MNPAVPIAAPRGAQCAQCNDLIGGQPRVFGVAAVMAGADLVAVGQHEIAGHEVRGLRAHHLTGEVDARDDRIVAHHTAFGVSASASLKLTLLYSTRMVTFAGRQIDSCSSFDRRDDAVAVLPRY